MLNSTLAFVAGVTLGLTFLASSVSKLRHPGAFVVGVLEYRILPPPLAITYGRVLPIAELLCGVALLAGVWPMAAGALAAALLTSFLVAVTISLVRGRRLDCHCFGSRHSEPLGWTTLARLCILLLCAGVIAGWRGSPLLAQPPTDAIPGALLALGAVLGLYLLGTVPVLWRIWRTPTDRETPALSRRVRLRSLTFERRPPPASSIPIEVGAKEVRT